MSNRISIKQAHKNINAFYQHRVAFKAEGKITKSYYIEVQANSRSKLSQVRSRLLKECKRVMQTEGYTKYKIMF